MQPGSDIGRMVLARLKRQTKVGAEEGRAELSHIS